MQQVYWNITLSLWLVSLIKFDLHGVYQSLYSKKNVLFPASHGINITVTSHEWNGVSNKRLLDCLFNNLPKLTTNRGIQWWLGPSFTRVSNKESISMSWLHHDQWLKSVVISVASHHSPGLYTPGEHYTEQIIGTKDIFEQFVAKLQVPYWWIDGKVTRNFFKLLIR